MANQLFSSRFSVWLNARRRELPRNLILLTLLAGILLTSIYSYLLFHSLAELFSVAVAFGVFIVAWNSTPLVKNNYLSALGIGSLFIALIDVAHTLAYKGMGVFTGYTANLPTQLWLAARYLQALTLLFAPLLIQRRIRRWQFLVVFAVLTTGLLASVFFDVFPAAYIEGSGLTPFKIASEYVIIAVLVAAIGLLWRNRGQFDSTVLGWLTGSIIATAAAEFAFTHYVGVSDTANLLGHLFKIIAFYLLYRAVVETGFARPYALLFRQLKQDEETARKARGEAEGQLAGLRSLSLQIMETMGQGLIVSDREGELEYVNPAFSRLAGISPQKLIGRHSSEVSLMDKYTFLPQASAGLSRAEKVYETTLLRADGSPIPVLVTSVPRFQNDVIEGVISVITDITRQKQSEARLRMTNRALTMLKDCNQLLVRSNNETELMQKMCEIIVNTGEYRMAWVGFAEQDLARSVRPVTQFGFNDDYLVQANITWGDTERGRGPTGTAIREGRVQVNQNFLTNPKMAPWRESAIKRGYQSSIALPLKNRKITFGALTIYATAPDAFDLEELNLLTELADDLAYGITMLQEREKRQRAERLIHEMALFPALNPDAVLQVDANGQIKNSNPVAEEMGFWVGMWLTDILPDLLDLDLSACIEIGTRHLVRETLVGNRILEWTIRGAPDIGLAFFYSRDVTQRKLADQEAENRAKEWRDTFDAMSEFVSVHDRDFKIVRANKALANYFGKEPDELVGKFCYKLFHNTDEPWPGCPHAKAMESRTAATQEINDPNIGCPLLISVSPIFGKDGRIEGGVHIAQDITDRKQAEEKVELERKKLKNILDTMSDGVYIVNQGFDLEYVNPAIENEFGQAEGHKCYQYLHGLETTCPWCVIDKVIQGEMTRSEWSSPTSNKVFELIDTPIRQSDGSVSKLGIRHDITLHKENEDQLKQANHELMIATQAEQNQRQLAEALVDAALALNKSLNLEEVLPLILEKIEEAIPYELAAITLLEDDSFYIACHRGDWKPLAIQDYLKERFPLEEYPILESMRRSGQPILILDTRQEPDWNRLDVFGWCLSFLSAPLVVEKQVIGFVNLFAGQAGFFSPEMRDRLAAFASHAAVAIQNAWLVERIKTSSDRLQSLSHRLVSIQESERQLIARELHDEAGQMLTSMKLDLHLLLKNAAQPELVIKKVNEMEDSVDEVQENLHRLAAALRPASLDHLGLVAAIRQHVESIGEKQGIKVSFKSDEFQKRLPSASETVLYRIVQEALTNIVRHANATQVDVLLTERDGNLIMIIEDNGTGFNPDNLPTRDHLGVFGMRERAEMIGGNLVIESTPGIGTTVMVEISCSDPFSEPKQAS